MKKVCIVTEHASIVLTQEILGDGWEVARQLCHTEDDLIDALKDADVAISVYEPFTKKVFDALPKLRLISLPSIGFNAVDIEAAKNNNVAVINNPHYCLEEVANHTMAMALALNRRLFSYNRHIQEEKVWDWKCEKGNIRRVSSLVLGLVGFGGIAKKIAKRFQAFEVSVIAHDPYVSQQSADSFGVKMVSLEDIYREADIISLHLPLNAETTGMINRGAFEKMKKTPILLNCARGALIDEVALIEALDSGKISGAGLDVLEQEHPSIEGSPLLQRENVIITPHAAFYSEEALREGDRSAITHILDYFRGDYDKVPIVNGIRN